MFENLDGIGSLFHRYTLGFTANNLVEFFLIILVTLILRKLVLYLFEKHLAYLVEKTKTDFDNLLIGAFKVPLGYLILILGAYLAVQSLRLREIVPTFDIAGVVDSVFFLAFAFVVLLILLNLIDVLGHYIFKVSRRTASRLDDQLVPLVIKSLKVVVVALTVLSVMEGLGWNVTSLLAGLGVGGLALALAAQETVSNLFGSFTVFSDQCFQMGDWIQVGDVEGTVEDVGLRSTRIRRFDRALVTVPNSRFIKSDIVNFTRMEKRRINFNLGVSYKTTRAQMVDVVDGIKRIIKEDSRFDHNFYMVHFTEFGASSLDIFIYCFTKTTVWDDYLLVREEFNLKIMELVEGLGVEIAYPTRTIYLEGSKGP